MPKHRHQCSGASFTSISTLEKNQPLAVNELTPSHSASNFKLSDWDRRLFNSVWDTSGYSLQDVADCQSVLNIKVGHQKCRDYFKIFYSQLQLHPKSILFPEVFSRTDKSHPKSPDLLGISGSSKKRSIAPSASSKIPSKGELREMLAMLESMGCSTVINSCPPAAKRRKSESEAEFSAMKRIKAQESASNSTSQARHEKFRARTVANYLSSSCPTANKTESVAKHLSRAHSIYERPARFTADLLGLPYLSDETIEYPPSQACYAQAGQRKCSELTAVSATINIGSPSPPTKKIRTGESTSKTSKHAQAGYKESTEANSKPRISACLSVMNIEKEHPSQILSPERARHGKPIESNTASRSKYLCLPCPVARQLKTDELLSHVSSQEQAGQSGASYSPYCSIKAAEVRTDSKTPAFSAKGGIPPRLKIPLKPSNEPKRKKKRYSTKNRVENDDYSVASSLMVMPSNNEHLASARDPDKEFSRPFEPFPTQELYLTLVSWKAEWLSKDYLLFLNQYQPNCVKSSYSSFQEYAQTYFGLHLLSMWCGLERASLNKHKEFTCSLKNIEETQTHFRNECTAVLLKKDLPYRESIILVTYFADGRKRQVFGYVYNVLRKVRKVDNSPWTSGQMGRKILFSFCTIERIEASISSEVVIQKLCKARVFSKQYEALIWGECHPLKAITVSPAENRHKIHAVNWTSDVDPLVDKIYRNICDSNVMITAVEQPADTSKVLLLSIVKKLVGEGPLVVCAKDVRCMHEIARKIILEIGHAVLGVKESEVMVERDLARYTLKRLAEGVDEENVLQTSKVCVTILSEIYISKRNQFFPETVCVVDDAHLHTEAETALAVHLLPRHLVMLGTRVTSMKLDPRLKQFYYDKSLFHRLCQVCTTR